MPSTNCQIPLGEIALSYVRFASMQILGPEMSVQDIPGIKGGRDQSFSFGGQ